MAEDEQRKQRNEVWMKMDIPLALALPLSGVCVFSSDLPWGSARGDEDRLFRNRRERPGDAGAFPSSPWRSAISTDDFLGGHKITSAASVDWAGLDWARGQHGPERGGRVNRPPFSTTIRYPLSPSS